MLNNADSKVRQRLRFTGRVQGVGFRYTASHAANALGLTGLVYNEWDGSVIMEVQGRSSTISCLIEKLDTAMFIEIDNIEKTNLPLVEWESSFEIKD